MMISIPQMGSDRYMNAIGTRMTEDSWVKVPWMRKKLWVTRTIPNMMIMTLMNALSTWASPAVTKLRLQEIESHVHPSFGAIAGREEHQPDAEEPRQLPHSR